MLIPCTQRSAKRIQMSSTKIISAKEAAKESSPMRIRRMRRPASLQRPTKGRRKIGIRL